MAEITYFVALPFVAGTGEARRVVAEVREALSEVGFMYVGGHGISPAIFQRALESSRDFFAQPGAIKSRFAYRQDDLEANFGFHGLEAERLDTSSAPDLKESFSMRNAPAVNQPRARAPGRARTRTKSSRASGRNSPVRRSTTPFCTPSK